MRRNHDQLPPGDAGSALPRRILAARKLAENFNYSILRLVGPGFGGTMCKVMAGLPQGPGTFRPFRYPSPSGRRCEKIARRPLFFCFSKIRATGDTSLKGAVVPGVSLTMMYFYPSMRIREMRAVEGVISNAQSSQQIIQKEVEGPSHHSGPVSRGRLR